MPALARSYSLGPVALARDMGFEQARFQDQSQADRIGRTGQVSQAFGDACEVTPVGERNVLSFPHNRKFKLFSSGPLHGPKAMEKDRDMAIRTTGQEFREHPTILRERLASALQKRLYPAQNLHRKQLCGAVGACGRSLDRWFNGQGAASLELVSALIRFFHSQGDFSFAHEVMGTDPGDVVELARFGAAVRSAVVELKDGTT